MKIVIIVKINAGTQEEAAEAYDIAAIKFRGLNAVTNFDMSRYDVRSIASSNLPIGGANTKPKMTIEAAADHKPPQGKSKEELSFPTPTINFKHDHSASLWAALGYQNSSDLKNPNHGIFQDSSSSGTAQFGIEFQPNGNEGLYKYQQHGSVVGVPLQNRTSHEVMSNGGNWIQTPIFGVE